MLKLADTVLILINPGPSNVKLLGALDTKELLKTNFSFASLLHPYESKNIFGCGG